jgi:hypothetical protein
MLPAGHHFGPRPIGYNLAASMTRPLHLIWFVPVAVVALFITEAHTIPFALAVVKLAETRWTWYALFSPSAGVCLGATCGSILGPLQGLIYAAGLTFGSDDDVKRRWLLVLLLIVGVLVLPVVTDFVIWGSFPFNIDNQGVHRLRLIPFFPWPEGPFSSF